MENNCFPRTLKFEMWHITMRYFLYPKSLDLFLTRTRILRNL
jgi:hypothetical protein